MTLLTGSALRAGQRDQHRHLLAIATVLIAEQVDQIALLEPDADQDIAGGPHGEQQMAQGHRRRRPEGEQEAEIDRMADPLVEEGRPEFRRRQGAAAQPGIDLAQAEQLEVVDEEGAEQHQAPADPEHGLDREDRGRVRHRPDRRQDRPPLPEQQHEREAREQHIGRALDGMRHEARPPALEGRAGHDAVLDGEDAEQQRVDDQAPGQVRWSQRCRSPWAPADCRQRRWHRGTCRRTADRRPRHREPKRYQPWDASALTQFGRPTELSRSNSVDRPSQVDSNGNSGGVPA